MSTGKLLLAAGVLAALLWGDRVVERLDLDSAVSRAEHAAKWEERKTAPVRDQARELYQDYAARPQDLPAADADPSPEDYEWTVEDGVVTRVPKRTRGPDPDR